MSIVKVHDNASTRPLQSYQLFPLASYQSLGRSSGRYNPSLEWSDADWPKAGRECHNDQGFITCPTRPMKARSYMYEWTFADIVKSVANQHAFIRRRRAKRMRSTTFNFNFIRLGKYSV
jgi:hypothetical protein